MLCVLATVGLAVGAVGCGGDDSSGSRPAAAAGSSGALQEARVVAFPASQMLTPYIARDEGRFEAVGLPVKIEMFSAGSTANILPQVLAGKLQIAQTALADIVPAIASGQPLQVLPGFGTLIEGSVETSTNTIVTDDPSIKELKDLAGKKVGLNALRTSHELYLRAQLEKAGVDADSVTFVAVPLANMAASIKKGQIDAGQALEPFISLAEGAGMHRVAAIGAGVADGLPSVVFWTSRKYAQEHPDEIAAFAKAMKATITESLASNPKGVADYMKKYTEIPPEAISQIANFGTFSTDVTPEKIEQVAKVLEQAGGIKSVPPPSEWIVGQQ
ncbi:ABC-type nitrate/sulfonate/bicarbonate transport system [Patulibacter medicamentivorans]|uniref:ABC-type nitrate/sulfonate/bicarbonate transport system n=1 Tax=Patulibacter medicamentivorans TaxID=1097667 RepID=H0E064_9ACTN|nr:ABC transporter substrate-binding protein [Patulibacter medicamentivorans]EHN12867.1 ABC-type nitrate/sulfonate/bicarbonate transport system [Patulibacter medicamentivorans]